MDRPTILVIDYEPRNLAATVDPLTAAGYHVEVARDGIAGLDAFRRLLPPVVFMEAMLPKKHAFEVCQEIRRSQTGRKTKVFILGAPSIAQSQQMKAVHQYGADRFLPRPVDGSTLVSLCSPVLPGPSAPQVPEIDLLDEVASKRAALDEQKILSSLEATQASPRHLELSAMSEDDIMAQLDQLLPSVTAPAPRPAPSPTPAPAPPIAVRPTAAPRAARPTAPSPVPVERPRPKPPAPPRATAPPPPVLVPPPPPEVRAAHVPDAAPSPPPNRSRLPMVLAGGVIAAAAFGSWMFLRPGATSVAQPVQATPFSDAAPLQVDPPTETPTLTEAPAPTPHESPFDKTEPVTSAPVPTPPPAPVTHAKAETASAPKSAPPTVPPKAVRQVTAPVNAPTLTVAQAAAQQPTPSMATSTAPATTSTGFDDAVPLPLAPPRLEPLPVGSDAARPRISPDVFLRRTQAGSLVDLHEVDKPPVAVSRPAPAYPPAARQMRREGEIELRLQVDAQGQVAAVELLSPGKSDLAAAAERAARQWKYRPAMKDGVPVQVKIVEKVTFKL